MLKQIGQILFCGPSGILEIASEPGDASARVVFRREKGGSRRALLHHRWFTAVAFFGYLWICIELPSGKLT